MSIVKADENGALIDSIYSAALGDAQWDVPLDALRELSGTRLSVLLKLDLQSDLTGVMGAAADDAAWMGGMLSRYGQEFHAYDPASARCRHWAEGRWLDDERDLSADLRDRGVFYQEFLRPSGIGRWSGLVLSRTRQELAFLAFHAAADTQGVARQEQRRHRLDALRPHLARAMRLQQRLAPQQERGALAETVFDGLDVPVFLLDETARLLLANPAAERLMADEPVLRFAAGRFAPHGCSEPAQWQAACAEGRLVLRRFAAPPLQFSLAPVPPATRLARHWQRPLILMTGNAMTDHARLIGNLRILHELTRAEAELCAMLALRGLSPQECAVERGVSIHTVRSQIRIIEAKTGARSLAQLVRLALLQA